MESSRKGARSRSHVFRRPMVLSYFPVPALMPFWERVLVSASISSRFRQLGRRGGLRRAVGCLAAAAVPAGLAGP